MFLVIVVIITLILILVVFLNVLVFILLFVFGILLIVPHIIPVFHYFIFFLHPRGMTCNTTSTHPLHCSIDPPAAGKG